VIREAETGDAARIAAIWNRAIRDTAITFNAEEKPVGAVAELIAVRRQAGHAFLVEEAGGTVAGFATSFQFRGGSGYRHSLEYTVMLAEHARGRGRGRALLSALEAQARAAGAHTLWAGVSAENPGGIGFHRACGFEEVAVLAEVGFKFGRWMDLVLFRKGLRRGCGRPGAAP
jgi:phosphinothricin acetyltransferase